MSEIFVGPASSRSFSIVTFVPRLQTSRLRRLLSVMVRIPPKWAPPGFYFSLLSSETVSFLRPFARRLANTLRPLAVCIRLRKPCTVLRRRLWGWNVRFI